MRTIDQTILLLVLITLLTSCDKNQDLDPDTPVAFDFEHVEPTDLGWNTAALPDLISFLDDTDARSFMIMVDGKVAMEEYFNGHTAEDTWQWNSAGKTLVATTTGFAQQDGFIEVNDKVSDYLGSGWTSSTTSQEDLINVKHLLTMTSGLDDGPQLVIRSNLTYVADAGSRWAYGNVFQRLMNVISEGSGDDFTDYFDRAISDKLGMNGFWNEGLVYTIYHSDTRSMAKYGHMILNDGVWNGEQIINKAYLDASISTSQDINPSYGYLWWLNGKSSYMLPSTQAVFTGSLVPNAPSDMYAAMGADEQRLYIIPSKNMVVIRMGENADVGNNFALSSFDNELWEKINAVIE